MYRSIHDTGWFDEVLSPDEFVETFQLAALGGEYQTYSRNHFRRVRP